MTKAKTPAKKAKPPKKRKPGRPSLYTPALVAEICERLGRGEPLAVICRDEHMPHDDTVRNWGDKDATIARAIARAREVGHDSIAHDCMRIADDASSDFTEGEYGPAFNAEHVQRSKLRIETRLKLLAKWDPKRYGEKIETTHKGAVGVTLNATPADEAL